MAASSIASVRARSARLTGRLKTARRSATGRPGRLFLSEASDDEPAERSRPQHQMLQQIDGRGVAPVQIFEKDHAGSLLRQRLEGTRQLEDESHLVVGPGAGGAPGACRAGPR